jgi:rhomboid protease GluP
MGHYWLTTAKWVSGDENAMEEFKKMATADDALMRHAAQRRLENPPASTPPLSAAEKELLDAVDCDLNDSFRYGHQTANRKKSYVTFDIAAIIILMFAVELTGGGARNLSHLWHLGALDPDQVLAGEYWRLPTSIFLHFG